MHTREAILPDAERIHDLISSYSPDGTLLPRSLAEICENVRDFIVLEEAGRMGRTLVTDNVTHFLAAHSRLMAEGKHHAGLLLASSRAYPRSKRTIGLWVRALTDVVLDHNDRSTEDLVTCLP